MLDVIIDPRDLAQPSFIHGAAPLAEAMRRLLPEATARARESWRRGATWEGMLEVISEIRDKQTNCFSYDNYTQLPLAFAFLSAKAGDLRAAEEELSRYAASRGLDEEETAKLQKIVKDCAGTISSELPTL